MHCCTQGKWIHEVCQLLILLLSRSSRFANLNDRLYTKLDAEKVKDLLKDRREIGGRVDIHSITAEEVLEQANKVFAPYRISFASPLSWFAVWNGQSLFSFVPSVSLAKT